MPDDGKPTTAAYYRSEQVELVRSTCLYIATKLGDLKDDLVVVGGLVPSLLIDGNALPGGTEPHVGTMDLDIGLTVGLLSKGRYRTLTERLRLAGFSPDRSEKGRPTRQRWRIDGPEKVSVDFLIAPSNEGDRGGALRNIEPDFAAIIAPGLHLAFEDREEIVLSGHTIRGEQASRAIWVCGPGAYVVLKAIAFDRRGENKDAYDLFYLVRNFGTGIEDIVARLRPLLDDSATQEALKIIRRDFTRHDGVGPARVAEFITGGRDDVVQADVAGFLTVLLNAIAG